MSEFSACFLLVFGQLAVGGIAGLAVPPFSVIERGFYKSSAGVFGGCAVLFLAGNGALALRAGTVTRGETAELVLWGLFPIAIGAYLASLWGDSGPRRARRYATALGLGLAALIASALLHHPGPALSLATLLYPLTFVTGALALGAVADGMLLGHWYLIDLGLSLVPLQRLFRYFVTMLLAHLTMLVLTLVVTVLGADPGPEAVSTLWREHGALLAARFVFGPFAALGLGYLIHRTLQIPQTMAATGLFYIAILAVLVGELLGRFILFRTSLPL